MTRLTAPGNKPALVVSPARPRPVKSRKPALAVVFADPRIRLGAGVASALSAAALPHLGPAGSALALLALPAVGLTRIYTGAHLPLDVAGGVALGLTVEAAMALAGIPERAHAGDRTGPESRRDGARAPAGDGRPGQAWA
jgi:hypothetical protein